MDKCYNVIIFTKISIEDEDDYGNENEEEDVKEIMDIIDPEEICGRIYGAFICTSPRIGRWGEVGSSLKYLNVDLKDVVMVDNISASFESQPENIGIRIKNFYLDKNTTAL